MEGYNERGIFEKNSGTIKNLVVEDVSFSNKSSYNTGVIAGVNYGTIENCVVKSDVTVTAETGGARYAVGGIAGLLSNGKIINCSNFGTITGIGNYCRRGRI